ncbi:hypothetical protein [Maritimibacter sp. UBA3975]|uniref:hypothetical protein n=1 Tax=Maritimibacter sp. UBA3975 TaxID=1946833 RepID=UPI000C0A0552|nr:hypothetical protein [Maritimibacter sp. UBA3975]MAM61026.1 hypothetical protein [Maritimibacter sp.]|tara:strand:+ start:1967 stop:2593 length:627 start_codon:yes stop_codon:yes gene_type:complete
MARTVQPRGVLRRTAVTLPLAALLLGGCGASNILTNSKFFSPASGAATPVFFDANYAIIGQGSVEKAVGGAAYFTAMNGAYAVSYGGIINGSNVGDVVPTGQAVYLADYEVEVVSGIEIAYDTLQGVSGTDSGNITLTADFDAATLTGEDGSLRVDGEISGKNVTGSVVYAGVDGDLEGLVGASGTVGAFHGNDARTIYAGGFAATRP